MQALLSVILCSHNPRPEYLERAIGSLKAQSLPVTKWEMLLVDNASTNQLAETWDLSWHPQGRHVREDKLGLTSARLRGIGESTGALLVFLDDDNVLAADFLEQAIGISVRNAHLGVIGAGRIEPEFESRPPPEVRPQLPLLALRSVGRDSWSNSVSDSRFIPWGAGLCVSRPVAEAFVKLVHRMGTMSVLGRHGKQLFSGEDDLFSWAATGLGLGFGIFPALCLTHLIAATRLRHDYLLRLIRGHAFSHGVINYLLAGNAPPSTSKLLDGVRLLLHGLKNGRFSLRCQWASRCGCRDAVRFIAEHRLSPIHVGSPALAS